MYDCYIIMCPIRTRKRAAQLRQLIKLCVTGISVVLLMLAFIPTNLLTFGDRLVCGSIGFLIFVICRPLVIFRLLMRLMDLIALIVARIHDCSQSDSEDLDPLTTVQETAVQEERSFKVSNNREAKLERVSGNRSAVTIETLNKKQPVNEITTDQEWRDFLGSHVLLKSFITKVVGVTFQNDDGTDRQEILSKCLRGEPIAFYWHDFRGSPACAVITDHGQIGYLRATLAADLDFNYGGDDYTFSGQIIDVTGGVDGLNYGCNIMINIYELAK